MADLKISNLPDVSPVDGSEIVPVTKDGQTGRIYVSGILVNSEETTKKYINDINVDVLYPLGSGYYTLSTAISAIPSGNLRKIGSTVTFQSASGVFERWQFIGTSTSTWTTTTLWINTKENIEGVRSQNPNTVPSSKLLDDNINELTSDIGQVKTDLINVERYVNGYQTNKFRNGGWV